MKFVVFGRDRRLGALLGEKVLDLGAAAEWYARAVGQVDLSAFPRSLQALLEGGDSSLALARQVFGEVSRRSKEGVPAELQGFTHEYGTLRIAPPLAQYGCKVICAGANFPSHTSRVRKISVEEAIRMTREKPFGFAKMGRLLVGDRWSIEKPARSKELDYEIEPAVVIGRTGRDIPRSKAMEHVFGFTALIDYSLRDQGESGSTFSLPFAKNFDGCGALGPSVTTAFHVKDPYNLSLKLTVNGQVRQDGRTNEMIMKFDELVEWYSRDITLYPGDIISGGTCAGTALERKIVEQDWSWFLNAGDVVEGQVEGLGTLRNRIVPKGQGEPAE